jgi:hypothetical protein
MSSTYTPHPIRACRPPLQITMNLLVKKIKRVGHGFRTFANYRLLLHCGVTSQDQPTARLRGRPRSIA